MKQLCFLEQRLEKVKTRLTRELLSHFALCSLTVDVTRHLDDITAYSNIDIDQVSSITPVASSPRSIGWFKGENRKKKKIDRADHPAEISVVQINTSKLPLP